MADEKKENNIFTRFPEGDVIMTIYENEYTDKNGENKTYLKATPPVSPYTKKDGEKAYTSNFSLNQLSDAIRAMQRAEKIMEQYQINKDQQRVFPTMDAETEQNNERGLGR